MLRSLLVGSLVVALAGAAHAQDNDVNLRGESPTVGTLVPVPVVAGDADATAVRIDAASMAYLRGWSLVFVHAGLVDPGIRGGNGDGLFFATPVPLLSALALGASVELVRPPSGFPYRDEAILSLAWSLKLTPALAFGIGWSHVASSETPNFDGLDTLDLSLHARLGRWGALAVVAHDVPSPAFQGLGLERVYEPELAVRPLGDDHLELAVAARIGERRGDFAPRLRLDVQPVAGLHVRGAVELVPLELTNRDSATDIRATAGLVLDLERIGVGGYALFGGRTGGSPRADGGAVTVRISGERVPGLWAPSHLERVDLDGLDDPKLTKLLVRLHDLERLPTDGVLLVVGNLDNGWASLEELRTAILRLRAAGRHVYAFGTELTTRSFYVASAAERLWVDPGGGIRLVGLSSTSTYVKGTFDKLGVRADFIKIAEYKSAPEQWTREGPSPEAQQNRDSLLDDIYDRLIAALAGARRTTPEAMRKIVDAGPYTAEEALKAHLVDGIAGGDEIEDRIGRELGHPVTALAPDGVPRRARSWAPAAVGVLYIDGDIVDGKSQSIPLLDIQLVGHEDVLKAIAEARADDRVKAIVVRIDSPGGSALASDVIARELERTRRWKPVICSLGDTAASGGYFIAAACDEIFASPSTITGSIGIFTGKFDVAGLADKLGVSWRTYKRGERADVESYWRPYTDDERKALLDKLRYFYGRFVARVASGRHMKPEEVDAIGRGHVWTGAQGKTNHLVDELGGFVDAVAAAKRRAGLAESDRVELVPYGEAPGLLGALLHLLGIEEERAPDPASLLLASPSLRALFHAVPPSVWVEPSVPQARMEIGLQISP